MPTRIELFADAGAATSRGAATATARQQMRLLKVTLRIPFDGLSSCSNPDRAQKMRRMCGERLFNGA
jgi:hypothetical protein